MFDNVFDDFEKEVARAEISMTPLIDMVFLLLIFFAVTTNFTKETGIKVDKASATTARILNKDLVLIAIDDAGNYWYDGTARPLENIISLAQKDLENHPTANVILLPDKNGRVEPLVTLMDALRTKGISRFSLGTKKTTQ
jgi:biopolymer transport protein ExbD